MKDELLARLATETKRADETLSAALTAERCSFSALTEADNAIASLKRDLEAVTAERDRLHRDGERHNPWDFSQHHNWNICDHPTCRMVRQYEAMVDEWKRKWEWIESARCDALKHDLAGKAEECERLKCCGNCGNRHDSPPRISWDGHECSCRWGIDDQVTYGWVPEDTWPMVGCGDPCHYHPSRWSPREEPRP
jgi:hypothetical protein